jgi:hypothetical protein
LAKVPLPSKKTNLSGMAGQELRKETHLKKLESGKLSYCNSTIFGILSASGHLDGGSTSRVAGLMVSASKCPTKKRAFNNKARIDFSRKSGECKWK